MHLAVGLGQICPVEPLSRSQAPDKYELVVRVRSDDDGADREQVVKRDEVTLVLRARSRDELRGTERCRQHEVDVACVRPLQSKA